MSGTLLPYLSSYSSQNIDNSICIVLYVEFYLLGRGKKLPGPGVMQSRAEMFVSHSEHNYFPSTSKLSYNEPAISARGS